MVVRIIGNEIEYKKHIQVKSKKEKVKIFYKLKNLDSRLRGNDKEPKTSVYPCKSCLYGIQVEKTKPICRWDNWLKLLHERRLWIILCLFAVKKQSQTNPKIFSPQIYSGDCSTPI